jgi:hypothetical protein
MKWPIKKCSPEECFLWIGKAAATGAILLFGYMGYMLLWPHTIIQQDNPIKVENKIVKRGTNVVLIFSFCKYKEYPSQVSFFLIDNTPFALRTIDGNLPLGCRNGMKYPILIPETVTPGDYWVREAVVYHINGLRDDHYFFETEHFTVTE